MRKIKFRLAKQINGRQPLQLYLEIYHKMWYQMGGRALHLGGYSRTWQMGSEIGPASSNKPKGISILGIRVITHHSLFLLAEFKSCEEREKFVGMGKLENRKFLRKCFFKENDNFYVIKI